jgi:hypothetical protein
MSGISVGAAFGEGFGLIRRRPLSVLVWGAILVGVQVAGYLLFAPYYLAVFGGLLQGATQGGGGALQALASPDIQRMRGLQQLSGIFNLFVSIVIYCAAFRAVLHPERSSFAYLRVGAPELFLAILSVAAFIALVIGLVVVTIPVAIFSGVVIGATGQGGGIAAALIILVVMFVAMIAAVLFIGLRFALVGPMMVADSQFHLFESWTLTRGRLGSLLLVALALFALFLVIDLVLAVLLIGAGVAAVQSLGGPAAALALLHQSPQALLTRLAPVIVVYAVIHVPLGGCLVAIAGAPWARVYRDLVTDPAVETFA